MNKHLMLDSGGSRGIPQGMKYSIKFILEIVNPYGGYLHLMYRLKGFSEHETFRVLVNGSPQILTSKNSFDPVDLEGEKYDRDSSFEVMKSSLIPYGNNSVEISVISKIDSFQPNFKS